MAVVASPCAGVTSCAMALARSLTQAALCVLPLLTTGCIKSLLLNGQIEATRQGSAAVDTVQDFEVARTAAFNGVAQFEGMHLLSPGNTDALFMLTKGWTGVGFAFIEDEMEIAEDLKDKPLAEYHKQRAIAAYDRAVQYGLELLGHTDKGFAEARKNDTTFKAWLRKNFTDKDDAVNLLWVGYAWMAKTNVNREDNDAIGDLFIGVDMVEQSVALDERLAFGQGLTILGAYHARTAQSELDEAEKYFQRSFAISQNRALIARFNYATKYLCARADRAGYLKTLQEIVDAGDIFPEQRLTNVIAKRKARRYLGKARLAQMREDCAFNDDASMPAAPARP